MELFRKIGPRVILVEYHGTLAGLVTIKDCLKYQFKVESEESPKDDHRIVEGQEQLWSVIRRASSWISDQVWNASGGRIRLSGQFDEDRTRARASGPILDGDEDVGDEGVELERRHT